MTVVIMFYLYLKPQDLIIYYTCVCIHVCTLLAAAGDPSCTGEATDIRGQDSLRTLRESLGGGRGCLEVAQRRGIPCHTTRKLVGKRHEIIIQLDYIFHRLLATSILLIDLL